MARNKKKKEQIKKRRKRVILRNRRFIENYKLENPCPFCVEITPCCLSFHHRDGDLKENDKEQKRQDWHGPFGASQ